MWNMSASKDKASEASMGVTITANSRMEMEECNEPSFSKPKSETVNDPSFSKLNSMDFFLFCLHSRNDIM
jgi:hypothetical protein